MLGGALFHSPLARVGLALLLMVTAYVLWSGGRLERWTAGLHAVTWILVALLQDPDTHRYPMADFLIDSATAAVFIGLVPRASDRAQKEKKKRRTKEAHAAQRARREERGQMTQPDLDGV